MSVEGSDRSSRRGKQKTPSTVVEGASTAVALLSPIVPVSPGLLWHLSGSQVAGRFIGPVPSAPLSIVMLGRRLLYDKLNVNTSSLLSEIISLLNYPPQTLLHGSSKSAVCFGRTLRPWPKAAG